MWFETMVLRGLRPSLRGGATRVNGGGVRLWGYLKGFYSGLVLVCGVVPVVNKRGWNSRGSTFLQVANSASVFIEEGPGPDS